MMCSSSLVIMSFQVFLLSCIAVSLVHCFEDSAESSEVSFEYVHASLDEETVKPEFKPIACKSGNYGFKEDVHKEMLACDPTCRHFCHLKIVNLMNDKGLPGENLFMQWVDQTFPEKYKKFSKDFFADCFKKYGNMIDLNDKECKIADQMSDCTWSIAQHLKCDETSTED